MLAAAAGVTSTFSGAGAPGAAAVVPELPPLSWAAPVAGAAALGAAVGPWVQKAAAAPVSCSSSFTVDTELTHRTASASCPAGTLAVTCKRATVDAASLTPLVIITFRTSSRAGPSMKDTKPRNSLRSTPRRSPGSEQRQSSNAFLATSSTGVPGGACGRQISLMGSSTFSAACTQARWWQDGERMQSKSVSLAPRRHKSTPWIIVAISRWRPNP